MIVITISGKAEAGKDATAKILKEKLEPSGIKCFTVHYADYLKFICSQYYGWDGTKSKEGREILQRVGTDIVRKRNPDFWVNTVVNLIKVIKPDFNYVLIPDTRFPNEIKTMKENFKTISVHVERLNYENSLTPEQRLHPSETSLDDYKSLYDYFLSSESGLENLEKEVDKFIKHYKLKTYYR